MATWECRGCTAVYAVDAPRCPHCGADDPIKEDEQIMPKITVHGGPSNAAAEEPADTAAVDETEAATAEDAEAPPAPEALQSEEPTPAQRPTPKRSK